MKIYLTTLLLIFVANILVAQTTEKTITITDLQEKGLYKLDTATIGHKAGDLYINRVKRLDGNEKSKDTVTAYTVHFVKPYNNGLRNYQMDLVKKSDFNKATYKWDSDSVVTVTLFTPDNRKVNVELSQPPDAAGCCSARISQKSMDDLGDFK